MSTAEQQQIRDAWNHIASGYDEFVTNTHFRLGDEALRIAGLAKDMKFLDIACGTGGLSFPAAQLGARVTAVDVSPAMVELISARAQTQHYQDFQALVMDGCRLDFENDMFDMVGSQFGVMLFPDFQTGLREMVRVTRPGGIVVLVAFGAPNKVEFINFMMGAMKKVIPNFTGLPMDPPPLPFQVADPHKLRDEFVSAGLKQVRVESTEEQMAFSSGNDLWDWLLNSNPIPGKLVADLSQQQKAEVRHVLDEMIRERTNGSNVATLCHPINIGIGIK